MGVVRPRTPTKAALSARASALKKARVDQHHQTEKGSRVQAAQPAVLAPSSSQVAVLWKAQHGSPSVAITSICILHCLQQQASRLQSFWKCTHNVSCIHTYLQHNVHMLLWLHQHLEVAQVRLLLGMRGLLPCLLALLIQPCYHHISRQACWSGQNC